MNDTLTPHQQKILRGLPLLEREVFVTLWRAQTPLTIHRLRLVCPAPYPVTQLHGALKNLEQRQIITRTFKAGSHLYHVSTSF